MAESVDMIDVAQRRQQEEIDHALAERQCSRKPGRTHCENEDCGEPISATRRAMGAQLCIDCARDSEQEARRWLPHAHG